MCRHVLAIVVAVGVSVVALSSLAALERRQESELRAGQSATYVDMGIRLVVVEHDPSGERMVPGNSQRLREVDRYERGGIVKVTSDDGRLSAYIVRESRNPVVWYVSRDQADLILHDGDCQWALVQGSEGSGKTTALAMWLALRVLEHIGHGREIGLTAPTGPRLLTVRKEIERYWRPSWFDFRARENFYRFHAGPIVQCVTAVAKSKDLGSPNQGNNWVAAGHDELQDHFEREPDFETRGRSAPSVIRNGRLVEAWYPRLCTSTFKDSSTWRTFRSACVANSNEPNPTWAVTRLLGTASPFIPAAHWEKLRTSGTMTPREFRRRVLAEEVGPESQLYHCWSRGENGTGNLCLLPSLDMSLHVEDVTADVLRPYSPPGVNMQVLCGHDPGKRQHVTVYLKAFRFASDVRRGDNRPRWYIVGETTTPDSTIEAHVAEVLKRLRTQWRCNELQRDMNGKQSSAPAPRQALVRIDPHSKSGAAHPGSDVYAIWRSFGIKALAANYDGARPAQIKVESRINLVNTLLYAISDTEDGVRRLFVACNEHGEPMTKNAGQPEHVVDSFESMERNEMGEAEHERKDRSDKSHWTAAVGYALWQVERDNVHRRAAA